MINRTNIILDSGAFSAWMKQINISVEDYAEFALENIEKIDYVVNLDVIPGSFGNKSVCDEEVERAAELGWKNYDKLIELGIPNNKLIHVFHQGDKFYHLERMIDELDYIGISPANDRTTSEKMHWLDKCMKYIVSKDGTVKIKFHGFAVTSMPLICKYPWYSVDSTSWVTFGKYGAILFPRITRGKFNYTKTPYVIFLSDKSPQQNINNKHYRTISNIERDKIDSYIEDMGFKIEDAISDNLVRDRINMMYYILAEKELNKVKIYYAGNFPMLSKIERKLYTREIALKKADTYNRLCSYYYKTYAERTLLLKEDKKNGKKKLIKRITRSKTRNSK